MLYILVFPYISINIFYLLTPNYKQKLARHMLLNNLNPVVFCSYIYSTLHALHISITSILHLNGIINTEMYKYTLLYTFLYMITDVNIMYKTNDFKKIRMPMSIHHLIIALSIYKYWNNKFDLSNCVSYNYPDMSYILARLLLAEIAVIFMNTNWFLIKLKKTSTNMFVISNTLFKISYFIFRVCNFSSFTTQYCLQNGFDTNLISIGTITIINLYWFYKLMIK